jgi:hypothetical protein
LGAFGGRVFASAAPVIGVDGLTGLALHPDRPARLHGDDDVGELEAALRAVGVDLVTGADGLLSQALQVGHAAES